jgi:hypothetical protein
MFWKAELSKQKIEFRFQMSGFIVVIRAPASIRDRGTGSCCSEFPITFSRTRARRSACSEIFFEEPATEFSAHVRAYCADLQNGLASRSRARNGIKKFYSGLVAMNIIVHRCAARKTDVPAMVASGCGSWGSASTYDGTPRRAAASPSSLRYSLAHEFIEQCFVD